MHPRSRSQVVRLPQADDDVTRTRDRKGAAQTEYSFPCLHDTQTGLACGQHDQVDAREIERADLLGREDSVFLVGSGAQPSIGTGESETREQKGIVAHHAGKI